MTLPNFIIFGAVKSGTGALHQYLSHHPEIFTSPVKEPRFFTDDNGSRGDGAGNEPVDLGAYEQFFELATTEKAIGEASSNYLYSQRAAERIRQVLPGVRLIASLRNPVDRAWAHYRMLERSGKRDVSPNPLQGRDESWAACSLYHDKLQSYFELFDAAQIKVLILEEWQADVSGTLQEIYRFLGVEERFELPSHINYRAGEVTWPGVRKWPLVQAMKPYLPSRLLMALNAAKVRVTPAHGKLSQEARAAMAEWYRDDIRKLEDLLGRDLAVWRNSG
jgi:hypothetical protein